MFSNQIIKNGILQLLPISEPLKTSFVGINDCIWVDSAIIKLKYITKTKIY